MKVTIKREGKPGGPSVFELNERNKHYLLERLRKGMEGGGPYRDLGEHPEGEAIGLLRALETTASVELFDLYRSRQVDRGR